jgi:predicted RND superfamily exporter protein
MTKRHLLLTGFYDKLILKRPGIIILCIVAAIAFLGYKARDFRLDASAETLLLESDEALRYSRIIKSRYGGYDYLLVTYAPQADLFSDKALADLARLKEDSTSNPSVTNGGPQTGPG